MAYTTINKSTDYFNTKLYTGNSSTQAITGIGFRPDFVWTKPRVSGGHFLTDSIRGGTKVLQAAETNAEITRSSHIQSFDTDGYTLAGDGTTNNNGDAIVSWNWKAGTAFTNDASSTGIGTIDSSGSVNDTAGFSIVSYTGGSGAGTIKHGLSTAPQVIILKPVNYADNWRVYHHKNTSAPETDHLKLHSAAATADSDDIWNDTAPTSSVFSIGGNGGVSGSYNFIAYCFAEKTGYSKFGSWTGNSNVDGAFIYCGFKPSFVLWKNSETGESWGMVDAARDTDNVIRKMNNVNNNNAESEQTAIMDFVSNGFKIRWHDGNINGTNQNHIFMAFGQSLVGSNNIPCTAR